MVILQALLILKSCNDTKYTFYMHEVLYLWNKYNAKKLRERFVYLIIIMCYVLIEFTPFSASMTNTALDFRKSCTRKALMHGFINISCCFNARTTLLCCFLLVYVEKVTFKSRHTGILANIH